MLWTLFRLSLLCVFLFNFHFIFRTKIQLLVQSNSLCNSVSAAVHRPIWGLVVYDHSEDFICMFQPGSVIPWMSAHVQVSKKDKKNPNSVWINNGLYWKRNPKRCLRPQHLFFVFILSFRSGEQGWTSFHGFKHFFFFFQEHLPALKPLVPVRGGPQGALQSSSSETTSLTAFKSSSAPCWFGARSASRQSPSCLRVVSTPPRWFCLPNGDRNSIPKHTFPHGRSS